MKLISSKMHGILDYLMGMLLIALPWLFDMQDNTARQFVPVTLGVATIVYSLFTDYELGLFRGISMRAHLTLDFMSAAILIISPWMFGFTNRFYLPHIIVGATEMLAVLLSDSRTNWHPPTRTPAMH